VGSDREEEGWMGRNEQRKAGQTDRQKTCMDMGIAHMAWHMNNRPSSQHIIQSQHTIANGCTDPIDINSELVVIDVAIGIGIGIVVVLV